MPKSWLLKLSKFLAPALVFVYSGTKAFGQNITLDGSLGTAGTLTGLNYTIPQSVGQTVGNNLFHSFSQFNLNSNEAAIFQSNPNIQNILSRVTGGNQSIIDGLIRTTNGVNLFFINPSGIIFGQNARLDVGGSFVASTANSFKFGERGEFSAINPQKAPLLAVNITPGLQYGSIPQGATITNAGNLVTGQDLILIADTLDLQGQLRAGKDLTLQAQNTLKVRDSVTIPFVASAGRELLAQGNQNVDIFAINHPNSGFLSGGDMKLRSANTVRGDARYTVGGNFDLETLDGSLGKLFSTHDPVIRASGNVSFSGYEGNSLHILAGGSVTIAGDVTITGVETAENALFETLQTSNGKTVTIDSTVRPILDIRAGTTAFAAPGIKGDTGNFLSVPTSINTSASANINIGGIISNPSGIVLLTNQYRPNLAISNGTIVTQDIDTSNNFPASNAGEIIIDARNSISTKDLNASTFSAVGDAGKGGAITLISANGNISTTGNLNLKSASEALNGNAGDGGDITLTAPKGNIDIYSIGDLDASSRGNNTGNGGKITLTANSIKIHTPKDVITYGFVPVLPTLKSYSFSSNNAGNGGAITLTATNGSIFTDSSLNSSSVSTNGNAGSGGVITLAASNNIRTDTVFSYAEASNGNAGNGGDITINSLNGNILTEGNITANSFADAKGGNGGAITFIANNGNVDTRADLNTSSSDSQAGAITLTAGNGNINTNKLISFAGSIFRNKTTGIGGNVNLLSKHDIVTSAINTTGKSASGNIQLTAGGNVSFRDYDYEQYARSKQGVIITTDAFGTGKGGNIQITASSIDITNGTQLSASTHSDGQGGIITLLASDVLDISGTSANQPPAYLFAPNGLTGILEGTYLGGYIPSGDISSLKPSDNSGVVYPSGVFTQTTQESTGNAGKLFIEAGKLIVSDGAAIAATTFGEGNAGNITIKTFNNPVLIDNGAILSGVAQTSSGNSGAIDIQAQSLSIERGGLVQTQTLGRGTAGKIKIMTNDTVNLSGTDSSIRSGSGNGIVEKNLFGEGGNIEITTKKLGVYNNAVITAQTYTSSKGGNILINTDMLNAENGGLLRTTTSGSGRAGNIIVNASKLQLTSSNSGIFAETTSNATAGEIMLQPLNNQQSLIINFLDNAQISASTSGIGQGGNLKLIAPQSITLQGNGVVSAGATNMGIGGNLTIETEKLTIKDRARATVSAPQGQAGNLTVTAKTINLNNGKITAETAINNGQSGANIKLEGNHFLFLQNNSLISAKAQGNATGGNINIDTTGGFVVAYPGQDNDIIASAAFGRGGNINITAERIFGLTEGKAILGNTTNDIDASSDFNSPGQVTLNTLDIDPNRGLIELPTNLVDVSQQIAQGCTPGNRRTASKFISTGRGGIPENPYEPLRKRAIINNWVTVLNNESQQTRKIQEEITTKPTSEAIVEAQGLVVNPRGEVELVAQVSGSNFHNSSQQTAFSCNNIMSQ